MIGIYGTDAATKKRVDGVTKEVMRVQNLRKMCPPTPIFGHIVFVTDVEEMAFTEAQEVASSVNYK